VRGGAQIGTAQTLSGDEASITTSGLSAATHSIYAVYLGSTDFAQSTSMAEVQTVQSNGPAISIATTTALSASAGTSNTGQQVTFAATVTGPSGPVTTGSVDFEVGGQVVGTSPLGGSGTASLTISTLPLGNDPNAAVYAGSTDLLSSSASLTQAVNPYATTVTLMDIGRTRPRNKRFTATYSGGPDDSKDSASEVL
jgi:hypothetical protein